MAGTLQSLFDQFDGFTNAHLAGSRVCFLTVHSAGRVLQCGIEPDEIINRAELARAGDALAARYGVGRVELVPVYPMEQLSEPYLASLRQWLLLRSPSAAAELTDSSWQMQEDKLFLDVRESGVNLLKAAEKPLSQLILQETGRQVQVCVRTKEREEDAPQERERTRRLEQALRTQSAAAPAKAATPAAKAPARPRPAAAKMPATPASQVIWGKPSTAKPILLQDLSLYPEEKVTAEGDIFFVEQREIKNGEALVFTFDFYDGTGSARVSKYFSEPAKAEGLCQGIKKGQHVRVVGKVTFNKFENDFILTPLCVSPAEKEIRQDTAEKKRVELHLHTSMSQMDAMADATTLINRACEWGHPAIAITDHGVAQAFPEAMKAAKGKEIQVIYGVEAYLVNDQKMAGVVTGSRDAALNGRFIVFDLETTGLKPSQEAITEIAAVKVENGQMVDEFQTYVNPHRPIPYSITQLTGITDEMVQSAPELSDALARFFDFAGEDILIAHNAGFDLSFLRAACADLGIEREFTAIDTLEMCRILLPHLNRHKLNIVAKELKVGPFEHHRASEDATVLARIVIELFRRLEKEHGVHRVSQINLTLSGLKSEKNSLKHLRPYHIILLVKNAKGMRNLYEMISHAHLQYFHRTPLTPRSLLSSLREGIIVGSACERGELFRAMVDGKSDRELEQIAQFYDYLEIQPIGNNRFMIEKGEAKDEEELRQYNRRIVQLGEKLGKPVVATGDVHFLEPEDEVFRRILMAGQGFSDADNQAPLYFKTTDEMLEEFSYLGKEKAQEVVVDNPNAIAALCEEVRPVPKDKYPPKMEGAPEELRQLCYTKAHALYGEPLPDNIAQRLERELQSIIGNGYAVLYMIAQKLVSKSIEDGYLVGSRGSVGSSIVAYFSGITEVNSLPAHYRCPQCKAADFESGKDYGCGADMPDKECPHCHVPYEKDGFDIPFETFLGFKGDKEPDIDLNFSGEYQAQAHKYTGVLFGEENVFRAGTIGTVAEKTAYGYVKNYMKERGLVCSRAEENRLVAGCTGIKRTTGQHPGGIIVMPRENEIYEFCPVQHPADDPNSDIITTHFDYHSIDQNLLKLDLLGHDDPTMIRRPEDLTGINARTIPLDDKETMAIFTSLAPLKLQGEQEDPILGTNGAVAVPEFGTKFVRGMLEDTKPTTFDELLKISGLSHGTDVWLGNAQSLITSGTATLQECICCRDDIMNYLIGKGVAPELSFTIMEAVRKGKGLKPEWEEEMRAHQVPEWYIDSCKKIKYMFPKAHAVAYVMMAFRIAWFKVHRPLAFYSAYFSIRAKGFDASCMIRGDSVVRHKMQELNVKTQEKTATPAEKEMLPTLEVCHEFYRRGFTFQPMNIYTSDATAFRIEGNSLIPPFTAMPGIGETAALSIVEEREKQPFLSLEELDSRCAKVSKSVIELLDSIGALDGIPRTTQISLF